ncbi:translation initiation factor [Marinilabiliaceae bacterium ANBcel2]|nr:translation initiation factor [Marinilabiliaceae bacterium ANBcel2]
MAKNRKEREGGMVFSTNPDYDYHNEESEEPVTLRPGQQDLRIILDRKQRKGKSVTLICGFIGTKEDMKSLEKELKSICGAGGSTKNEEILIQGDFRDKIVDYLKSKGYKAKKAGGN